MVFTLQILILFLTSSTNIFSCLVRTNSDFGIKCSKHIYAKEVIGYKPFDDPNMVTLFIGTYSF